MQVRVLLEPPARTFRGGANTVIFLRIFFLIVGMVALGWSGYVYVDSDLYQRYEDYSFDQHSKGSVATLSGFLQNQVFSERQEKGPAESDRVADVRSTPHITRVSRKSEDVGAAADPGLLGRIAIPRLEVHAMVREGVDDHTLRRSVGHVPGTAEPGADGNVGLAGHRDSFFRKLKDIRKDDKIVIETLDSKFEYTVDSTKIVGPNDVEVLAPTPDRALTLVTCYPFYYVGNAPRRFIVRARQVSVEARDGMPGTTASKSGS